MEDIKGWATAVIVWAIVIVSLVLVANVNTWTW